MQIFWGLLTAVLAAFLMWQCYRYVQGNKQAFSRENRSKSATALAYLAFFLIAVVALCVLFLR